MSKLKLGVVGCGGIANQKHFPALKNNADLNEIVAFCDIKVERAEKAAKEFGAPGARVYADYKELLADPEVEVVHVCTPNVSLSEITIAAFEAGKHMKQVAALFRLLKEEGRTVIVITHDTELVREAADDIVSMP